MAVAGTLAAVREAQARQRAASRREAQARQRAASRREAQARQRAASRIDCRYSYPHRRRSAYFLPQASASIIDSKRSALLRSCASSVAAINLGISENGILRSRNACTATSSAAFSTAGAVPPLSITRYPSEMHGNFFPSGGTKSHPATDLPSRGGTGDERRSG